MLRKILIIPNEDLEGGFLRGGIYYQRSLLKVGRLIFDELAEPIMIVILKTNYKKYLIFMLHCKYGYQPLWISYTITYKL